MRNVVNWLCRNFRLGRRAVAGLGLCATLSAQADTYYVDPTSPNDGPGNDWAHAFHGLAALLSTVPAIVHPGDEVHVAGGTTPKVYTPTSAITAIGLKSVVSIQGGYAGNDAQSPATPDDRDPDTYRTILSGDVNSNSNPGLDSGNAGPVVSMPGGALPPSPGNSDPWDRANLDGFEITGGWGDNGGAILGHGDATNNVVIRKCKIYNNYASVDGGGFYGYNVTFCDCEFYNNHTDGDGGAMYLQTTTRILHCKVYDNSSDSDGGGIAIVGQPITIVSSTVAANQSDGTGGGLSIKSTSGTMKIINSVIVGNHSDGRGGGVEFDAGSGSTKLEMTNCTVAHNTAGSSPAALYYNSSSTTSFVKNSILWFNTVSTTNSEIVVDTGDTLDVDFSDIEGGFSCGGCSNNIGGSAEHNPDFEGAGNYRLQCSSPCMNEGTDAEFPLDQFDVDENGITDVTTPSEKTPDRDLGTRMISTVDMGAYETGPSSCPGDLFPVPCGDDVIDVDDLLTLINAWGTCASLPCVGDANGNGEVDVDDLLIVINAWGTCQESASMPVSIQGCMDYCNDRFPNGGTPWSNCIDTCVEGLCRAEIIDCDE